MSSFLKRWLGSTFFTLASVCFVAAFVLHGKGHDTVALRYVAFALVGVGVCFTFAKRIH